MDGSHTESLNLLPSSFNFDLNLSKETLQFVNQFANESNRFNSLVGYDPSTSQTTNDSRLASTAYSNESTPNIAPGDMNNNNCTTTHSSSFDNPNSTQHHHQSSDFDNTSANTSANTNKSNNNPLLSCSTYNNESEDETNWESLL